MSEAAFTSSAFSVAPQRRRSRRPLLVGLAVVLLALLAGSFLMGRSSGGSATGVTAGSTNVDELLASGLQLHLSGQVPQAKAAYERVLSIDPENAYANYNLGEIAQVAGDDASALSYYDRALATDPTLVPAMYNRALVLRDTGDPGQATVELRKVVAADPNNAGAAYNLGVLLIAGGDAVNGVALVNHAIDLDPSIKRPD